MAHYHSDQYPPYQQYPAQQPPPPPPRPDRDQEHQHPYASPAAYPVNGLPYLDHGYSAPAVPGASNARPQDELFFAGPPVAPRYGTSPHSPDQQQPSYNPLDYAAQITPSTPQSAVSLGPRLSISTHQPYVPADYAAHEQQSSQYYAPGPLPSPPTPQGVQRQSSVYTRPTVQTGSYSSYYTQAGLPPLPSIPSATEAPSNDFGQFPPITRYTSRYGRPSNTQSPSAPSPPSHHRRTSSSTPLEYTYTPSNQTPSPAPPPPPPHASYGRPTDLSHRPLPSLPANDPPGPDYFAYEEKQVQASLENQILSSVGATPSPQPPVCAQKTLQCQSNHHRSMARPLRRTTMTTLPWAACKPWKRLKGRTARMLKGE
jgi:hypothetical protein